MIPQPFNIERELAGYFKACYGHEVPALPASQYRDMRQSFYAGVASFYAWLQDWCDANEGMTDADMCRMYAAQVQMVKAQIQNYGKHHTGN